MSETEATPAERSGFSRRNVGKYRRIVGGWPFRLRQILVAVTGVLWAASLIGEIVSHHSSSWLTAVVVVTLAYMASIWWWMAFWHRRHLGDSAELPEGLQAELLEQGREWGKMYLTEHHGDYWLLYLVTSGKATCIMAWNGTELVDIDAFVAAYEGREHGLTDTLAPAAEPVEYAVITSLTTKEVPGGFVDRQFILGQPAERTDGEPAGVVKEIRPIVGGYVIIFDMSRSPDILVVRDPDIESVESGE